MADREAEFRSGNPINFNRHLGIWPLSWDNKRILSSHIYYLIYRQTWLCLYARYTHVLTYAKYEVYFFSYRNYFLKPWNFLPVSLILCSSTLKRSWQYFISFMCYHYYCQEILDNKCSALPTKNIFFLHWHRLVNKTPRHVNFPSLRCGTLTFTMQRKVTKCETDHKSFKES